MNPSGARILLTGAGGFIGRQVDRRLREAGAEVLSSRSDPEIRAEFATPGDGARMVGAAAPDLVINAAAMARAGDCELDEAAARRINCDAAIELADAARAVGARFLHFSTDQVFDGESGPYADDAPASPVHAYGRTKAAADALLLASPEGRCILRPTLVYGPSESGRDGASDSITAAVAAGRSLDLFVDEWRCPVPVDFVADVVVAAITQSITGVVNVAGGERVSRHEFGLAVCEAMHIDPSPVRPVSLRNWRGPRRPADLHLVCRRLRNELELTPPTIRESLTSGR